MYTHHDEGRYDVHGQAVQFLQEFQLEDVEADILVKDRIGDVEVRAVGELQDLEPQTGDHRQCSQ